MCAATRHSFKHLHNAFKDAMHLQGRAHMLSNMRYHTSVVIYLFAALGTLGVSSRKLMKLSAYSDRISELEATVKDVGSGKTGEGSWDLGDQPAAHCTWISIDKAKKHHSTVMIADSEPGRTCKACGQ